MLHKEVLKESTLELLRNLEKEDMLSGFNLAGGTSLALYLGHRYSEDLDLFTPNEFDTKELESLLTSKYAFKTDFTAPNTVKGSIGDVKIDCITHAYEYIRPPFIEDDFRLYDMADVVAMKLSAIADNGSRMKDFIDIACLSTRYSLASMLMFYERKFPASNVLRPLRAITYFEDIDFEENIVLINRKFDWRLISKRLNDMLSHPQKTYSGFPFR